MPELNLGKVVGTVSNPNLLDNWYFPDPINQRNQTEYVGSGYCIDRFVYLSDDAEQKAILTSGGVELTGTGGTFHNFQQYLESEHILYDHPHTLTFLLEGSANDVTQLFCIVGTDYQIMPAKKDRNLITSTFTPARGASTGLHNTLGIQKAMNVPSIKLIAAKLELGDRQTLARQGADGSWVLNDPPPNKALELAKCQRYQWIPDPNQNFWLPLNQDTVLRLTIPFPVKMRVPPAFSFNVNTNVSGIKVNVDNGRPTVDAISLYCANPGTYVSVKKLLLDANL